MLIPLLRNPRLGNNNTADNQASSHQTSEALVLEGDSNGTITKTTKIELEHR